MSNISLHTPPITPYSALWNGRTVGLLGGSFNPAHAGHEYIAREALKRLGLDAVWLLVSPSNPLKNNDEMAPLTARMLSAERISDHARIITTTIENDLGTNRTMDSIDALMSAFPKTKFVWLMGADNMQQFRKWYAWQEIASTIPIAIFDRPKYSMGGLTSDLARVFAKFRTEPKYLKDQTAPAWSFVTAKRHPASATNIRRDPTHDWPAQ